MNIVCAKVYEARDEAFAEGDYTDDDIKRSICYICEEWFNC